MYQAGKYQKIMGNSSTERGNTVKSFGNSCTRAVIIPFFAGLGIGIGIRECQISTLIPNPDSDPAPTTDVKILYFVGFGMGIKEYRIKPQFRIRIRIQRRNYNSSKSHSVILPHSKCNNFNNFPATSFLGKIIFP